MNTVSPPLLFNLQHPLPIIKNNILYLDIAEELPVSPVQENSLAVIGKSRPGTIWTCSIRKTLSVPCLNASRPWWLGVDECWTRGHPQKGASLLQTTNVIRRMTAYTLCDGIIIGDIMIESSPWISQRGSYQQWRGLISHRIVLILDVTIWPPQAWKTVIKK